MVHFAFVVGKRSPERTVRSVGKSLPGPLVHNIVGNAAPELFVHVVGNPVPDPFARVVGNRVPDLLVRDVIGNRVLDFLSHTVGNPVSDLPTEPETHKSLRLHQIVLDLVHLNHTFLVLRAPHILNLACLEDTVHDDVQRHICPKTFHISSSCNCVCSENCSKTTFRK